MASNPPSPPRARALLLVIVLGLVVAKSLDYGRFATARAETLRLATIAGLERNGQRLWTRIDREQDPLRARLRVARAIVADELDPTTEDFPESVPEPQLSSPERRALARRLASEAHRELPASWEAALILGAATYLDWSKARDDRLFLEAGAWESPLSRSLELAPGRPDATAFLATAYLELWPALSAEKQEVAVTLFRRAFREPDTLNRLLVPWLERARSPRLAFSALPDKSEVWRAARDHYAGRDWNAFLTARERFDQLLRAEAAADLAEGKERLAGRDLAGARELLLTAAARAPVTTESATLVDEAFRLCPAGRRHAPLRAGLQAQLDLALDLFLHRESPFAPETVRRLATNLPDLPHAQRALIALAGDRLVDAEAIERRHDGDSGEPSWAPYQLAKTRQLLQRQDLTGAQASFDLALGSWHQRPAYQLLQRDLARARGDSLTAARVEARLAAMSTTPLPVERWRVQPAQWRLEWFAEDDGAGLETRLGGRRGVRVALEIRLDGRIIAAVTGEAGKRLRLPAEIAGGEIHILEVDVIGRSGLMPGSVRVLPGDDQAAEGERGDATDQDSRGRTAIAPSR